MSFGLKTIILFVILGIGIWLRFLNLGVESYWCDEVYSVEIASHEPLEVLSGRIASPAHPPLYNTILSLWTKYFPINESSTRLLSLIFSLLTMPVIYLTAKIIKDDDIFKLSSLSLYCVSLFSILYSQETRSYSMLVFLAALSLLAQLTVFRRKEYRQQLPPIYFYFFITLLGIFTHYIYFLLIFIQIIIWIPYLVNAKSPKLTVLMVSGFLLILGIFYFFWGKSNFIPSLFNNMRGYSIEQRVGYVFGKLEQPRIDVVGNLFRMSFNNIKIFWRFRTNRYLIVLLFISLFFLDVKKVELKRGRESIILAFKKGANKTSIYLSFPIIFTLFIILCTPLVEVVSNFYYYIFILPNLIFFIPYTLLRFLPRRIFLFLIIFFICVSIVGDIDYLGNPHKTEFKNVAQYLMSTMGKGQTVAMVEGDVCYVMSYYLKGDNNLDYSCVAGIDSSVKADFFVSKDSYPESEKYKKVKNFYGLVLLKGD